MLSIFMTTVGTASINRDYMGKCIIINAVEAVPGVHVGVRPRVSGHYTMPDRSVVVSENGRVCGG